MSWKPINTVEKLPGEPVLLAYFRNDAVVPDYVVMATYGSVFLSGMQIATMTGWFVDPIPIITPPSLSVNTINGFLPNDVYGPTHWMKVEDLEDPVRIEIPSFFTEFPE